jgi:hypothetical protein
MPETNYSNLGVTVPVEGDYAPGGPDVPRAFKAFADSVGSGAGAGKLIIAQSTGAAAFKAMKGDATLAADGTLTLAGHYPAKVINTEESRTSTAYGTMATADEITGVVVPANGVVMITYEAIVKSSVSEAGVVSLFIGANQIAIPGPSLENCFVGTKVSEAFGRIYTSPTQAISGNLGQFGFGSATTVLTTGRVINPIQILDVAAGTYTVSVKFKATSGSVTAKERVLRVEVHGF